MLLRKLLPVCCLWLSWPVLALEQPSVLQGEWVQGGVVVVQLPVGVKAWADDKPLMLDSSGRSLLGLGRDATSVALKVQQGDEVRAWRAEVQARTYDVQRIDGLPDKKVNPPAADVEAIKKNNADIAKARALRTEYALPLLPMRWPVSGRISGVYGSQRVLNGQPRRPHFGVDVAAPEGTPVYAPADGRVVLRDGGMVLTGQTLMLDHGLGLKSIYVHLSDMLVQPGEVVVRGQMIGRVGKTGRATGPHLHWGVSWFDVQVDPARLTDTTTPPALQQAAAGQ